MADIVLSFCSSAGNPALDSVHFTHPLLSETRYSYRGKGLSAFLCRYSFQWSPAVRAISTLFLRTKGEDFTGGIWPTLQLPALSGATGSQAASLDYALSKRPLWLLDMFGVTAEGNAIANQLFSRWNAERKRGGEVIVGINPQQLRNRNIEIILDRKQLPPEECSALARAIEETPLRSRRILTEAGVKVLPREEFTRGGETFPMLVQRRDPPKTPNP